MFYIKPNHSSKEDTAMATKEQAKMINNIWMITREYEGLANAGGVKDVSRQLSEALARSGRQVSVVLPLYGFMNPGQLDFAPIDLAFEVDMPYEDVDRREYVRIYSQKKEKPKSTTKASKSLKNNEKLNIYLVDAERFLEKKSVYTYTAEDEADNHFHQQGKGHYDYFAMNILLQKAAIALMISLEERPDVIHCHDGHTAILPAMIRETEGYRHYFKKTGAVVTIHNAGIGYHQEVADLPFAKAITGLPEKLIADNLLDDKFDPFLAASPYAIINTVSENYARELRETEDDELTGWLGHRLTARGVKLAGVTNGINPADFNPRHPKKLGLSASFSPAEQDFAGKKKCRKDLILDLSKNASGKKNIASSVDQTGFLTNKPDQPLFTFVGRFSSQKGVDKLLGALETLLPLDQNFQILILGTGTKDIETSLIKLAKTEENEGRICILRGYDTVLANRIYAAGDFFLIPSQYEPCGLTDYIAQLFGNLPIVHRIGGLIKVVDGVTGFSYRDHKSAALMGTMQKAMQIFRKNPDKITKMQLNAIENIYKNYSWDVVLQRYLTLYKNSLSLTL